MRLLVIAITLIYIAIALTSIAATLKKPLHFADGVHIECSYHKEPANGPLDP